MMLTDSARFRTKALYAIQIACSSADYDSMHPIYPDKLRMQM